MIALDASAVIYLTKKHQSDADGLRGRKAETYLDEAFAASVPIAVPSVALSEVLASPDKEPDAVFEALADYDILDFDTRAAILAGEIASTTNWKSAVPPFPGGRQVVKLDILIASSAIPGSATILLTNDNRYEKLLANHPIQIVLIDSLPNP